MKRHLFIILILLASVVIPYSVYSQRPTRSDMVPYPVKSKSTKKASKQPADFSVFSNPSTNKLTFFYSSKITEKAHIAIYDEEGKLVSQKDVNIIKGPNTWEYDLRQNTVGVLFVKFKMKNIERTVKVIKSTKSR